MTTIKIKKPICSVDWGTFLLSMSLTLVGVQNDGDSLFITITESPDSETRSIVNAGIRELSKDIVWSDDADFIGPFSE
jgi:hypothetical protein